MVSTCAAYIYKYILYVHVGKHERLGSKRTDTEPVHGTHKCPCRVHTDAHVARMQTFQKDESQQGVDHVRTRRG